MSNSQNDGGQSEAMDGGYRAESGTVWKNPIRRRTDGGTSITIGFPVCKMTEAVGDEAAETVAELLNRGELLGEITEALRHCQRVLAMMTDPKGKGSGTAIISAYAQCVEAESKARAALSKALGSPDPARSGGDAS